jgi:hypothetical protein
MQDCEDCCNPWQVQVWTEGGHRRVSETGYSHPNLELRSQELKTGGLRATAVQRKNTARHRERA